MERVEAKGEERREEIEEKDRNIVSRAGSEKSTGGPEVEIETGQDEPTVSEHKEAPNAYEILFICTSTRKSSWGADTGAWLKEISDPYYVLKEAGYQINICSLAGGPPPLDPSGVSNLGDDSACAKFLSDEEAQRTFSSAKSLNEITSAGIVPNFSGLYFVGGHGCADDFYKNEDIKTAVELFLNESKGPIGAICHGPLGLANCFYNEKHVLKGKFVAAFSNEEENILGLASKVPILTEDVMDDVGAVHVPSRPWDAHAVVDGRIVTGQNPNSSTELAQRMLDVLRPLGDRYSAPQNVNKPWGK